MCTQRDLLTLFRWNPPILFSHRRSPTSSQSIYRGIVTRESRNSCSKHFLLDFCISFFFLCSIRESRNARPISRGKINRSVAGEIDRFRPRSETDTRVFVYARPWSRSIDNLSAIRLNLATRFCTLHVHATEWSNEKILIIRFMFHSLDSKRDTCWIGF